jgi:hypothetical protein
MMGKKKQEVEVETPQEPAQAALRKMLPLEWAYELKVSTVIVNGAFAGKLNSLVDSVEFKKKLDDFLNKKADGGN